jgi:2-polyprenyl-3-methyl-5-hydroxy-6-metoxy-1,4-benzoquinol methylase
VYQLHSAWGSSHRLLASLARKYGRSPILDVGMAGGYLGQMLAGSGLVLDGIEPNPDFVAAARPWYRKIKCGRVEEVTLEEDYGAIVFGDVLEHLADPVGVLVRLSRHLKPDGVLLISLPNIAHLSVRLLLLSGRFPRMDRGPLDRTHLHFYTRATAEKLIAEAGFRVVDRRPSVVPLVDIAGNRWRPLARLVAPVQRPMVRLLPGLFAYQWIFAAVR